MKSFARGAFIQYPTSILRPLVNVVIFQFNPEELSRGIEIPPRPSGTSSREVNQAGDVPVEKISLTAHFTADDPVMQRELSTAFGVGPQLSALEKLVRPAGPLTDLLAAGIDKLGDALSGGKNKGTQPIPRESYPRVLFIWGLTRMLPVTIDSMQIVEKQYDQLLNPTRAEVTLGITVVIPDRCDDDFIAKGASTATEALKEVMSVANFANSFKQVKDIFQF
jgi:hypothetical protein